MRRLLSLVAVAAVAGAVAVIPTGAALAAGPAPVTGLHAVQGAGSITLAWVNPVPAPAHVYVREAVGTTPPHTVTDGTAVTTPSVASSTVTVTGLSNATKYSFSVFASDGSVASVPVSVTSAPLAATTLSIGVHPPLVSFGAKSEVSGRLRLAVGSGVVKGEKVTLYQRLKGTSKWVGWSSAVTDANGIVRFPVSFGRNTQFELRHTANLYYGASTSKSAALTVKAAVSISGPAVVKTFDTVMVTGRVKPAGVQKVYLERYTTKWTTVKSVKSSANGVYSFALRPTVKLVYQLRAYVPATTVHAAGLSSKLTITVADRDLTQGESGPDVLALQRRLAALHYDVGAINGSYGYDTYHAVVAFEKVQGLVRNGAVTAPVRQALAHPVAPRLHFSDSGRSFEVNKSLQIVIMGSGGSIQRILDSSTGFGGTYYYANVAYQAITPEGTFHIQRKINGVRISHLGSLYRPAYFFEGYAIHGEGAVPAYPASHGCVRITVPAMDRLYDLLTIGTPVHIYH